MRCRPEAQCERGIQATARMRVLRFVSEVNEDLVGDSLIRKELGAEGYLLHTRLSRFTDENHRPALPASW